MVVAILGILKAGAAFSVIVSTSYENNPDAQEEHGVFDCFDSEFHGLEFNSKKQGSSSFLCGKFQEFELGWHLPN